MTAYNDQIQKLFLEMMMSNPESYVRLNNDVGREIAVSTYSNANRSASMSIYNPKTPPSGFYVYAYIRLENSETARAGTPYYIGKGSNDRAIAKHIFSIPKNLNQIIIIEDSLTELGSLALERRLIAWWGRKDIGTGILNNRTDGGEGATGHKHSEETKQRIISANTGKIRTSESKKKYSDSRIGDKNPMFGKVVSEENRQKKREANKRYYQRLIDQGLPHPSTGTKLPRITCPHCGKNTSVNNYPRFHGNNCKGKNND